MVIDVSNLIGDTLYTLRPVAQYLATHPLEKVDIVASPGIAFELVKGSFPLLDILRERPEHIDITLSAGAAAIYASTHPINNRVTHISEAFSMMMGMPPEDEVFPITQWAQLADERYYEKEFITIAPFSRSCTIHTKGVPNKTLEPWKWGPLIEYLRNVGLPIRVLCGPGERLNGLSVSENEYYTSGNLRNLESILKRSKFLVSVDTGVAHIASALTVKTIILWPAASNLQFIGPAYSKNTQFILMPNDLQKLTASAVLSALRVEVKKQLEESHAQVREDQKEDTSSLATKH